MSSDNTLDVIYKYKAFINKIISEKDNGVHEATSKGISLCTGDYIIIVAGDDFLLPNAFEYFENTVKKDIDVWCGSIVYWKAPRLRLSNSMDDLSLLEKCCSLRHPASFISKKAFYPRISIFI